MRNSAKMWIELTYRNWKGKVIGHTSYITKKSQLQELADRYEIRPEDLLSFKANSKEYEIEEVRTWIS